MIHKLRFRLILAAMLSLTAVLVVVVGIINIINYHSILTQSDRILSMLSEGEGRFMLNIEPPKGDVPPPEKSPELAFESRFFWVLVNDSGAAVDVDISHIAAIDETTAANMASDVYFGWSDRGFKDIYRYTVHKEAAGSRIIFLDCTRSLNNFYTFLWASLAISAIGLAAVLVLLFFLSGRIIRPIVESHEKQKQFITNAGHELKTPLTIIHADAEVLEMELGQNEWLSDIRKQTEDLTKLTEELTYLSRMEEQQPIIRMDFPLSEVVEETTASFLARAKTREQALTPDIQPMITYYGDEKALRRLVSLLLDNALKYSPEGTPLSLRLSERGKSVTLTVFNHTLTPLSKEEVTHLFDRFYRTDPSRSTSGYGIGLSMAQAIVTAHRGRITAQPVENTLTLTVTLPK